MLSSPCTFLFFWLGSFALLNLTAILSFCLPKMTLEHLSFIVTNCLDGTHCLLISKAYLDSSCCFLLFLFKFCSCHSNLQNTTLCDGYMYVLSFCFTVAFMSLFLICIVEKDYCFYISALSEVIIILDLYIINTKDTEY